MSKEVDEAMTIEQAVATLNAHEWRGRNDWFYPCDTQLVGIQGHETWRIHPIDAIAIATYLWHKLNNWPDATTAERARCVAAVEAQRKDNPFRQNVDCQGGWHEACDAILAAIHGDDHVTSLTFYDPCQTCDPFGSEKCKGHLDEGGGGEGWA